MSTFCTVGSAARRWGKTRTLLHLALSRAVERQLNQLIANCFVAAEETAFVLVLFDRAPVSCTFAVLVSRRAKKSARICRFQWSRGACYLFNHFYQ